MSRDSDTPFLATMSDVPSLLLRLGIRSDRVQRKAMELVRLANVKCGTLGKGEVCKSAACVELACKCVRVGRGR